MIPQATRSKLLSYKFYSERETDHVLKQKLNLFGAIKQDHGGILHFYDLNTLSVHNTNMHRFNYNELNRKVKHIQNLVCQGERAQQE